MARTHKKVTFIQTANVVIKIIIWQLYSSLLQLGGFSRVFKKILFLSKSEQR